MSFELENATQKVEQAALAYQNATDVFKLLETQQEAINQELTALLSRPDGKTNSPLKAKLYRNNDKLRTASTARDLAGFYYGDMLASKFNLALSEMKNNFA